MEGKTNMLVGYWHGEFTNVPLAAIHNKQKRISPSSQLWHSVIASTGQPPEWN
jgi:6-phosphofructokinase 1